MALEFFVEMRKIRRRLATFVEAPRSRSEQRLFQLPIIPAFGQRPSHPCRLGVFQILVNRSVSDRAATGDLPLPQSQLVSESQYFFELSHGQPFRGQCWFPPLTSGTLMPALLSSVLRPAPSRTVQGLWKSFRNDLGQGSGHRRKVTGLRSESVTGFIPESCPASFRNGARNDFGIVPGLPRNPHTLLAFLYLAQTVRRTTDWRDDFTFFSRTLEASPNSPDMENGVAQLLRSERADVRGAEHHYLRAVALAQDRDPPEWDQIDSAYVGLALIYSERGQFDQALDALDKAQAADPNDNGVQSARGGVLLQVGRWREAEKVLHNALQANANDENTLNGLGIIAWQDEHQYEQAVDYFQRALRAHPASDSFNASLHNNLGAVYCEMGRCSEGIAHFQRAVELTPDDPEYRTNLGSAFGLTGHLAEARAELEKVLTVAPNYAPARASLSNLEEQERRTH